MFQPHPPHTNTSSSNHSPVVDRVIDHDFSADSVESVELVDSEHDVLHEGAGIIVRRGHAVELGREVVHGMVEEGGISPRRHISPPPAYRDVASSRHETMYDTTRNSGGGGELYDNPRDRSDRQRTERIRDTERTSTVRPRSSHSSRRRSDPYVRPRPSPSSATSSRSTRDSRIERESRSYPYYEREARRSNGGNQVGTAPGSSGGSSNNGIHLPEEEGDQEPLILRIGVSSQTVTDTSSNSSASSSDTENEE